MAFSQPLTDSVKRKGQSAMLCQLCETDPKLKWKCLQCELLMCQRCKDKVHPKFPSAKDHTIINIKDISKHDTNSESKPDLTRITCEVHSGQMCCLYCKTCECLVCQSCIAKTHNKHEFREINDEYQTKIEKAKIQQKELESAMQNLTMREGKLKNVKLTEQSNYDKVKQEILDFEKSLVNEIKKHTNKLLEELDQKCEALSKSVDNELKKLKKNQSQIEKQIQQVNDFLLPSNGKEVFSVSASFSTSLETEFSSVLCTFQGVPKFIQGDQINISLVVGKLEETTIPYKAELQVETEFMTDLEDITSVISCPDGSLWLCNVYSAFMKKVKPNGDNLIVLSTFEIQLNEAALLPSGDLLFSVQGSPHLKLIPFGSSDVKDFVFVSSLQSTGPVHVTHDNKIIVGIGGSYVVPAKKLAQVIVMDQTGHHEKVFLYDRQKKPLFTHPYHITSESKGDIAVVDCVSDDCRGRVVVLDQEGEVRNIYTGHPDVNNEDNPFTPKGITTTPSDNFVVVDIYNHTLHILNSKGENITFYNTMKMGIILPNSLSFSTTGQLYIGCGTYGNSDEKVKLFKVKNFLF